MEYVVNFDSPTYNPTSPCSLDSDIAGIGVSSNVSSLWYQPSCLTRPGCNIFHCRGRDHDLLLHCGRPLWYHTWPKSAAPLQISEMTPQRSRQGHRGKTSLTKNSRPPHSCLCRSTACYWYIAKEGRATCRVSSITSTAPISAWLFTWVASQAVRILRVSSCSESTSNNIISPQSFESL